MVENSVHLGSGGDNGAVIVYDIEKFQRLDSISLNGRVDSGDYRDSLPRSFIERG